MTRTVVSPVEIFKQRSRDNKFITANHNSLVEKYNNRFIAVKEEKIVASGKDFEVVLEEVRKKGLNPSFTIIRFIFKKGYEFIL